MRGGFWSGGAVAQAPRQNTPGPFRWKSRRRSRRSFRFASRRLAPSLRSPASRSKPRVDTEITEVHSATARWCRRETCLFTLDSRAHRSPGQAGRGPARGREGQPRAGRTRCCPLHRAGRQERHHHRDAAKCQNPGEHLALLGRFEYRRSSKISTSSSAIARSARRSRGASAWLRSRSATSSGKPILTPLATIIQTAPVYVTFALSQGYLPESAPGADQRKRDHRGRDPGRPAARERPGDHDREQRRRADRHGAGSRHHAERGRVAWPGTLVTVQI